MRDVIVIHYGELALKQGIRRLFEKRLMSNIKESLADLGTVVVERLFGRFVLDPRGLPFEPVAERLAAVFGIASFGRAVEVPMTWDDLEQATDRLLPREEGRSFGVRTKKADGRWTRGRTETSRDLGAFVVRSRGWKVDLTAPDIWVQVEIANGRALVGCEKRAGSRGLPVGTAGRALALLSGGIDSPVAAHCMMSRGLRLSFAHFHSAPYTDRKSQDKVREIAERLLWYQPLIRLHMIPFAPLQQVIVQKAPEEWRVLLYRRFMMRVAARLARDDRAQALVTGESLGQVASQTLTNLRTVEAASPLPVLRPLVGLDKETISRMAEKAGTYAISIRPHDDCCSLLLPRSPLTRSHPKVAEIVEADLDVASMVKDCCERVETTVLRRGGEG